MKYEKPELKRLEINNDVVNGGSCGIGNVANICKSYGNSPDKNGNSS
jgi:hypothetical protein